jgi:polyhydroxyalkanoate synthase subunit PhaE
MSPQDSAASLYESWLRVVPAFFAAMTPGVVPTASGIETLASAADGAHPTVKPILEAVATAQQVFTSLYVGYAQAIGAGMPAASGASWLQASSEAMKRILEQGAQLLGTPALAFATNPLMSYPLITGLEQTFTALGDAIGLAPTRALRDAYRELVAALAAQRAAQLKFLLFLGKEWGTVAERLATRLREMSSQGENIDSLLAFVRMWAAVADDTAHDAMQSEEGVRLTTEYIRAATRARQQRTRLIEILSELCNVPTRAEVDDVHREIHDVKKQLRQLTRGEKRQPVTVRKKRKPA